MDGRDLDRQGTTEVTNDAGYRINYRLKGTIDYVNRVVSDLLIGYHPAGYGTTFNEPKPTQDGLWEAFGYRYASCD